MRKPKGAIIPARGFFQRDTRDVARDLLGHFLAVEGRRSVLLGRIVETEAYMYHDDPACHASRGMTRRNRSMFEAGGIAYVYLIYGIHYCLNIVSGSKGEGTAVLMRSIEPIAGLDEMRHNRPGFTEDINLANGPGKLTRAMGITIEDDGADLLTGRIRVFLDPDYIGARPRIVTTGRIGINQAADKPLRYYIKNHPCISRK